MIVSSMRSLSLSVHTSKPWRGPTDREEQISGLEVLSQLQAESQSPGGLSKALIAGLCPVSAGGWSPRPSESTVLLTS